ncbi:hypothetical protein, partial [Stenotrophomonas maltophilia]
LQAPWVGGLLDRRPAWREMATYGLPIVLLILVSVAILLAMNRRLRREVSRRRQLERELRDSEQHYRGLVESLN